MQRAPEDRYFAVIFRSELSSDPAGYQDAAAEMEAIAARQPGYLGFHSARSDGHGISISYWQTDDDIRRFKSHADHLWAQREGRNRWYRRYSVEVCEVQRHYQFDRAADTGARE
jgi:heme-degrading monooxygenase HmoA